MSTTSVLQVNADPICPLDNLCTSSFPFRVNATEPITVAASDLQIFESPELRRWRVQAQQTVEYEVVLCADLLDPQNPMLAQVGSNGLSCSHRRLCVIDAQVHRLYGQQFEDYFRAQDVTYEFYILDAHETVKTIESVLGVVTAMDRFGIARRSDPVIAVGGGVLTDIVGLAANLYRRSTPYIRVPTTLMGMIDAGIGVKTGINFAGHKNRLGTYYGPLATLIDPGFLQTSDTRHLCNGFAEILKIALIKDEALFHLLEVHGPRLVAEAMRRGHSVDGGVVADEVMRRSIHGMLQELQPNLWEHDLQRLVDYGHSFSPTIEMQALPGLLHGEAVAIDMAISVALAHARGLLSATELVRVLAVIRSLKLPVWHPVCTTDLLMEAMADTVKHRNGRQLMPLTDGIGNACFVNDISSVELEHALEMVVKANMGTEVPVASGGGNA